MKNNKILWIVSVIPFILSSIALVYMPNKIPMHYDMAGNIDRWGSKYEVLIMPIAILAISFMWQCFINFYNKKAEKSNVEKEQIEAQSNVKILRLVAITSAIVFGITHMITTYSGYVEAMNNAKSSAIDINAVINVLWGIVMVILGNYMPKAKRNGVVGFRTKKSMSDDKIWQKTNRFAGISFMVAGVLIVIESLIIGGILSTGIMVGILLVAAVVDLVYAARL